MTAYPGGTVEPWLPARARNEVLLKCQARFAERATRILDCAPVVFALRMDGRVPSGAPLYTETGHCLGRKVLETPLRPLAWPRARVGRRSPPGSRAVPRAGSAFAGRFWAL